MSTELQKQVSAFKKKTVQVQSLQKGLPSIFLSPKEAAAVDTSAVYEAGCKGLRDLIQYDERFSAFESSLFHSSSVNLQRELKTKEENAEIDVEVNSLLNLLSLWANEPSAHLVLEYLVRRYRVHEFNMDSVLRAFLIAHDSKLFAKIVHLCRLEESPWIFLAGVKESGVPPPRALFVNQALKSPWILDTICDLTSRTLSLLGLKKSTAKNNVSAKEMESGFRALSLTTAIIVEVANKSVFREDMLRNVCLLIIEGLKSKIRSQHSTLQRKLLVDWKVASCVILSQLSVRTQFGDSIIKAFSKALSVAITMAQEDEDLDHLLDTLMTTAIILAQGRQFLVDENVLRAFFPSAGSSSWFYSFIEASEGNHMGLLHLIASALSSASIDQFRSENSSDISIDSSSHIVQFLKRNWIDNGDMNQYLSGLLSLVAQKQVSTERRDQLDVVVRAMSDFQPHVFNLVVKSVLEQNPQQAKTVTKYLSSVFSNFGKTIDVQSGDSIFLNLSSAVKELRVHALTVLESGIGVDASLDGEVTANQQGIAEALIRCLEDADHEIASHTWNSKFISIIEHSLGAPRLFQSILIAWQMWSQEASHGSKSSLSLLNNMLHCLSGPSLSNLFNDPSISKSVEAWALLASASSIALHEDTESKTAGKLVVSSKSLLMAVLDRYKIADKKQKSKSGSVSDFSDDVVSKIADDNQHHLLQLLELSVAAIDSDFGLLGFSLFLVKVASSMQQKKHLLALHTLLSKCLSPLISQLFFRESHNLVEARNKVYAGFVPVLLPTMVSLASETYTSFDASLKTSLEVLTKEHTMEAVLLQLLASSGVSNDALRTALDNVDRNDILALLVRFLQSPVDASFPVDEVTVRTIALCSVQAVLNSSIDVGTACLPTFFHLLRHINSSTAILRSLAVKCFESFYALLEKCTTRTLILRSDVNVKVNEIALLVHGLIEQKDSLLGDGDAVLTIMYELFSKHLKSTESVSDVLLLAAASISYMQDSYASFLVQLLPTSFVECNWKIVMYQLKNMVTRTAVVKAEGFLTTFLSWIAKDLSILKTDKQEAFIHWLCDTIKSSKSLEATLPKIILTVVIPMLPLKALSSSSFEMLLRCLFTVQSTTNGSKDIVNAILSMEADPSLGMVLLQDALTTSAEIEALLRVRKNSIIDDENEDSRMQVDEEEESAEQKDEGVAGYESKHVSISAKLRSMVAVAEMVVPMVLSQAHQLHQFGQPLFRALFTLLDKLCQPGSVSVMNLEFYKTITSELIVQLLNKAKSENLIEGLLAAGTAAVAENSKTPSKSKNNKKKTDAATEGSTTGYTVDLLRKDLCNILHSLSSVRSTNIHTSALGVIRHIVTYRSDALSILIELLGEFLSQTAVHGTHLLTRGKILINLLSIIVPAATSSSSSHKSVMSATRDVVFHIMKPLPSMPANHRSVLLKALAKLDGQKEWMTLLIIQSLLQHTLVKYESKTAEDKSITVDSISLSRAAQRRAQRVLMNSDSEEFYHLAEQFLLEQPSLSIIKSVIKVLDASRALTLFCIGGNEGSVDTDDIDRLINHYSLLRNADEADDSSLEKDAAPKRGHAATIAVLQLEFVNEILLSPQFHRQLASDMLANRVTHSDMMEVAECSLQICVECDSLRQSRQRSTQRAIMLRIENESHHLSAKLLSEIFADLSLGVLGNMQALLDGPSFLTMIQELLDHEVAAIRQRAIIFLKDRLQSLLSEKRMSQIEHGLYLDLCSRLRAIIKSNLSKLFDEKKDAGATPSSGTLSLPYAQSALLAIDVLVLKLGKTPQWQTVVMDILGEYLSYFDKVYDLVGLRSQSGHYQQKALESRKFLGSLLLSCSSLCMALNAAALPSFPTMMEKTLRVFVTEASQWRDDSVREMNLDSDRRAHVLFLRSLISAAAIMISSLPKFSHPYIATILPLLLEFSTGFVAAREIMDMSGIDDDSEACMTVIGQELPPRLALPAVCGCLSTCIELGGDAMYRYVTLLQTLVTKSDRATCVNQMTTLLPTVLSLMTELKMETNGLNRHSFVDVQQVIGELVVELCLKLTENELKSFILRLIEWKSGTKNSNNSKDKTAADENDEKMYYRLVHFYSTINSLLDRFQSLFFSSISLLWTDMMTDLDSTAKYVKKMVEKVKSDSKDDGKKRKRNTDVFSLFSDETKLIYQLIFDSITHVMSITRSLCTITGASFIDEKRYETLYPKILSFVPIWQAFDGDDSYFQFARQHLTTTLCELCANINRDLLWKPLNHQVLLFTRNASPLVRIVAVDLLRELFEKVGADYLAVLPECLSYISELLEDDNSEVVKHTRQAIAVIEDLSGESLDSYLQ